MYKCTGKKEEICLLLILFINRLWVFIMLQVPLICKINEILVNFEKWLMFSKKIILIAIFHN